jgi:hypothetical protein
MVSLERESKILIDMGEMSVSLIGELQWIRDEEIKDGQY